MKDSQFVAIYVNVVMVTNHAQSTWKSKVKTCKSVEFVISLSFISDRLRNNSGK